MQHAVEEIGAMTESLQASGFERRQADATVRAIASSIEKFAVTPEVLRKAFDGHRSDMNARFEDQRGRQCPLPGSNVERQCPIH